MSKQIKIALLLLISVGGIVAVFCQPRIPQDPAFHHFADERRLFGIPNFWNVISNALFLLTGGFGIVLVLKGRVGAAHRRLKRNNLLFFTGIFLTALGSCYYHLYPDNSHLVFDRLPMTISFMAFFSVIIALFIEEKTGRQLSIPLVCIGVSSVLYWAWTESAGMGDLRFYFIIQFLPMILIPLILLLFKSKAMQPAYIWLVVLAYLLAKVLEAVDVPVYEAGHLISGHSLKHVIAALAPLIYLAGIRKTGRPQ